MWSSKAPSHTTATGKEVYSFTLAVEPDFFPVFALFLHDVAGANAANGQELHNNWINAKELELTTVVCLGLVVLIQTQVLRQE